ncbi:MFS transporter [Nonomuraea fuscirosea]|uniref:MFS transporter n=1 Tax=Nonomuraea fuscirosea TaxID=1291556 RepID=UPI0037148458
MLFRYMAGAVSARTGDEMSGPALLVMGLAVTGSPVPASWLLAGLTVSAAAGGPLLGVLLDRSARPGRLLASCLLGYAGGLLLILALLGRVPDAVVIGLAVVTGLLGPALTGGWTAQLPLVSGPGRLGRATALDSMSYNVAGLAGPALVGAVAAFGGGGAAVLVSAGLLIAALPAAYGLPSRGGLAVRAGTDDETRTATGHRVRPGTSHGVRAGTGHGVRGGTGRGELPARVVRAKVGMVGTEVKAGVSAIVRNVALRRATVGSMVSCCGLAMLVVSAPVLGERLTGQSGHGALLLAVTAAAGLTANAVLAVLTRPRSPTRADAPRPWDVAEQAGDLAEQTEHSGNRAERAGNGLGARFWDVVQAAGTAVLGVGMVVLAVSGTFWVAVVGAAVAGLGEGPQLTALFAVRHREAPARLRSQVFTMAASVKITSFALGSALAGPLAAYDVGIALLTGAALQATAAAVLLPRGRSG